MVRGGLLLAFGIVTHAAPTNAIPRKLSLPDCIQIALEHNLEVKVARFDPDIARHYVNAAYGAYAQPWGYCGLFVADLIPATGNDDKAAPSKPATLNATFDPASQSIPLTWGRCKDNAGVDACNIYRKGEKIAVTGFIDYRESINS